MLKLLLTIALVVVASHAQELIPVPKPAPAPSLCLRDGELPTTDEVRYKINSGEINKAAPLSLEQAQAELKKAQAQVSLVASKSADLDGAAASKAALSDASGAIIDVSPSPSPKFNFFGYVGPACPHYTQYLKTFYSYSSRAFCYVLFPSYQKIWSTRCRTRNCITGCPTNTLNYCRPDSYRTVRVWALCKRGNFWYVRRESTRVGDGQCRCYTYRRCVFPFKG